MKTKKSIENMTNGADLQNNVLDEGVPILSPNPSNDNVNMPDLQTVDSIDQGAIPSGKSVEQEIEEGSTAEKIDNKVKKAKMSLNNMLNDKGRIDKRHPLIEKWLFWFMAFVTFTAIGLLTSYYPLEANIPLNILLGLCVLFFLRPSFFEGLKLSTLLIMRFFIIFAVTGLVRPQGYVDAIMIFLVINILEATLTDLKRKKYFNFVSGLVLAIGVYGLQGLWVGTVGFGSRLGGMYTAASGDLAGTICYIIAYTIWNWVFVTYEFSPAISFMHVGTLLAPIFGVLLTGNPGYWLIFRANTLTFTGVVQIGCKGYLEKRLKYDQMEKFIKFLHTNWVQAVLMIINVGLVIYTIVSRAVFSPTIIW